MVTLLLGALGIALTLGPLKKRFIEPGELTRHHAVIGAKCSECHVFRENRIKELHAGLAATEAEKIMSEKCSACHEWGEDALNPHALPGETLERLSRALREDPGEASLSNRMGPPMDAMGRVACVSCHREHQGRDFELAALDDSQCQSCHTAVFASFGEGHPGLEHFGYERRTRIVFEHRDHEFKHFEEVGAEFSCVECHAPGPDQAHMVLESYESMCATCHDADLMGEGSTQVGMKFLQLPGVDVASLRAAGVEVGDWPADADEGFDAMPSIFVDLLVSADETYPEFADDQEILSALDLADLYGVSQEEAQAAGRYVRAVRRLVDELARNGQGELLLRLERVFDPQEVGRHLLGVADRFSEPAMIAARAEWFGQRDSAFSPAKWTSSGGWLVDSRDFALRYLPDGHPDGFLRAWHEVAVEGARSGEDQRLLNYFMKQYENCTTCHSVDLTDQSARINWHGETRGVAREFTKFSHKPHVKVVDQTCTGCHEYREDAAYMAAFKRTFDPGKFAGEFEPFSRDGCASCHNAAKAGDECLKCHRYHVGEFDPALFK